MGRRRRKPRPCRYELAVGGCRAGADCKFAHTSSGGGGGVEQAARGSAAGEQARRRSGRGGGRRVAAASPYETVGPPREIEPRLWAGHLWRTEDGITIDWLLGTDERWREQWSYALQYGSVADIRAFVAKDRSLLNEIGPVRHVALPGEEVLAPMWFCLIKSERFGEQSNEGEEAGDYVRLFADEFGVDVGAVLLKGAAEARAKQWPRGAPVPGVCVLTPLLEANRITCADAMMLAERAEAAGNPLSLVSPHVPRQVTCSPLLALVRMLEADDAERRSTARALLEQGLREGQHVMDEALNSHVVECRRGQSGAQEMLDLLAERSFDVSAPATAFFHDRLIPFVDRSKIFTCKHAHEHGHKFLVPAPTLAYVRANTRRMSFESSAARALVMCCALPGRNPDCPFSVLPWELCIHVFGRAALRRAFQDDVLTILETPAKIEVEGGPDGGVTAVAVRSHGICLRSFVAKVTYPILCRDSRVRFSVDSDDAGQLYTTGECQWRVHVDESDDWSRRYDFVRYDATLRFDTQRLRLVESDRKFETGSIRTEY